MEYCGPPDPTILQATIRRLEAEIERLNSTGVNKELQKQVEQLTIANRKLIQENQKVVTGIISDSYFHYDERIQI